MRLSAGRVQQPSLRHIVRKIVNSSLRAGDKATVASITQQFYIPLVRLRSKKNGYAVSLIKAGAKIIGRIAGEVRPPLSLSSSVVNQCAIF